MRDLDLINARVKERLDALGMSERAVSMKATGKPDALRFMRTRKVMPSGKRFFAIAQALEASPDYLLGNTDTNDFDARASVFAVANAVTPAAEVALKRIHDRHSNDKIDSVIIFHTMKGPLAFEKGEAGLSINVQYMNAAFKVVDFIIRPKTLEGHEIAGFRMQDTAMDPVFPWRSLVLTTRSREARPGDYVMIYAAPPGEDDPNGGSFLVRRLIGRTDEFVTLEQFNPAAVIQLEAARVGSSIRVVTYEEILTGIGG